jgi:hypothetical protein
MLLVMVERVERALLTQLQVLQLTMEAGAVVLVMEFQEEQADLPLAEVMVQILEVDKLLELLIPVEEEVDQMLERLDQVVLAWLSYQSQLLSYSGVTTGSPTITTSGANTIIRWTSGSGTYRA